ncbi:MAG: AMP-binding protein [Sphingobium sp.]|nr:AMP-binding protein [Sphingobium sp.]
MPDMIAPDQHDHLASYIGACCRAFSDRPAFVQDEVVLTYAQTWEQSGRIAGFLRDVCGVHEGDRVAVMLPNVPSFPLSSLAVLRVGAVQVNVNPLYTARELRHQLEDAEVAVIIACKAALPALLEAGSALIRTIILVDTVPGEYFGAAPPHLALIGMEEVLGSAKTLDEDWLPSPNGLAFLQYTGGTTGLSKGAMLTHANILANVRQFLSMGRPHFQSHPTTVLTAIPLYHIFALTVNMFAMFALGAKNILVADPRNMGGLVEQWARHRINFLTGVNTLFKAMCADERFCALDFAPELLAMGGGASVQKVVSERWAALTGRHIREGYGLSETSPILTCTPFDEQRFLGSIGRAVPDTELVILDMCGRQLGMGEVGELCARGPQVMRGYWRRADASADVMTSDGFFRTGDMARFDAEGRFYIVDRQKDMILVSGFNVYPNEVEAVVAEMPEVIECACVGRPDAGTGEAVCVFVVRKDGALTEQAVRDHCRTNLAAYKVPREVRFIDDMPKSNVGKILRRELRAMLFQESRAQGASAA